MKTATEVAIQFNAALRTIQRWCKVLGFEKTGRDYILTPKQVSAIKARLQGKPGRPAIKNID